MFETELRELEQELAVIAGTTVKAPPDWHKTKIGNWGKNGLANEVKRLFQLDWWKRDEPRDERGEILALLKRAGLGNLRDGVQEENVHAGERGVTASEIVEYQHNKQKIDDEGDWRSYLGNPGDDAREWLKKLSTQVDTNAPTNKSWWGTLRDHVYGKPNGAKVRDLNPGLIELCVQSLCTE